MTFLLAVISIHALLAESDVNKIPYQRQIDQFLSTLSLRRATMRQTYHKDENLKFLSTLSLRRATITITITCIVSKFLSTLSLRRATILGFGFTFLQVHFYPRSPCGERLRQTYHKDENLKFLSTLSLRRATRLMYFWPSGRLFLSTLSLRRATDKQNP